LLRVITRCSRASQSRRQGILQQGDSIRDGTRAK
jgi:hypothetical protein